MDVERYVSRDKRLSKTGLRKEWWDNSFSSLEVDTGNQDMVSIARRFVSGYDRRKDPGRGLLFIGNPGIGKTKLATLIGVALSDEGKIVRFTELSWFIQARIDSFALSRAWQNKVDVSRYAEWENLDRAYRRARGESVTDGDPVDLLIVDDAGKEHSTTSGFSGSEWHSLLRRRHHLGLPTIVTSNFPMERWKGEYSEAMASFAHEAFAIVNAPQARDRRKK